VIEKARTTPLQSGLFRVYFLIRASINLTKVKTIDVMQSFHHVTSKEVNPELLIVQRINHIVPAQKIPIHHIRKNPALAARDNSSSV
jgi:hypothetical protein